MTGTQSHLNGNMILGRREIKQFSRFENGRMVFYGYSVGYDRYGNETDRTEPEVLSSVGWNNEQPFTAQDCHALRGR